MMPSTNSPARDPAEDAKRLIRHLFASKAARDGGVIRRKVADVDAVMGRSAFLAEMSRRGVQVVENGGQYVIFCNRSPVVPHLLAETRPRRPALFSPRPW